MRQTCDGLARTIEATTMMVNPAFRTRITLAIRCRCRYRPTSSGCICTRAHGSKLKICYTFTPFVVTSTANRIISSGVRHRSDRLRITTRLTWPRRITRVLPHRQVACFGHPFPHSLLQGITHRRAFPRMVRPIGPPLHGLQTTHATDPPVSETVEGC